MAVKATDQVTVLDVSDAYSVTLSNEAATFKATSDTKLGTAATATTTAQAFCGTEAVSCTVNASNCVRSDTTNCTVSVDSTGTWPVITITLAANATAGGTVTIPVVIDDVTISKVFSYSIALKGTQGTTGERGALWYSGTAITGTSTTPATFSGSGIASAIVGDMYLNTSTGNTYQCTTAGNASTAKWKYVDNLTGPQGATGGTGAAGGRWYTGTGITGTSSTATVFSGSGVTDAVVGDMYLNTSTSNTYKCTVAGNASTAKWVYVNNVKGQQGIQGNPGADALTISITSSAGFIFKNSDVVTTLTAHVFKAGLELTSSTNPTLASVGTIRWYKDGGSQSVGTGQTLSISAGDVTNKATYTAQLEG